MNDLLHRAIQAITVAIAASLLSHLGVDSATAAAVGTHIGGAVLALLVWLISHYMHMSITDGTPPANNSGSSSTMRIGMLAMVLIPIFSLAGCAVSAAFKDGSGRIGSDVAVEATNYVNADPTLTAGDKAERIAQISVLSAAATSTSRNASSISSAWSFVSPWYRVYVAGDKSGANVVATRKALADDLDRLIASEQQRTSLTKK